MKRYIKASVKDIVEEPYDIQMAALKDPRSRISVGQLNQLSLNLNDGVRRAVAERSDITKEIAERLSNDSNWVVRVAIADNESTPIRLLRKLAKDPEEDVRYSVAYNPKTPTDVLVRLAEESYVQCAIAQNPSTPKDILERLAEDKAFCEDAGVRRIAKKRLLGWKGITYEKIHQIRRNRSDV